MRKYNLKSVILLLVAMLLTLVLCGCNGGDGPQNPNDSGKTEAQSNDGQSEAQPDNGQTETPKPVDTPEPVIIIEEAQPGLSTAIFTNTSIVYMRGEEFAYTVTLTAATFGYENQQASNLFDLNPETVWRLPFHGSAFVEWDYGAPVTANTVVITSGNDAAEIPAAVRVSAKAQADDEWTNLVDYAIVQQASYGPAYSLTVSEKYGPYQYYRLEFLGPQDGSLETLQLADVRMELA